MRTRRRGRAPSSRSAMGLTLAELLTVLAIVATLSALALPTYLQQQRKVRRGDARAALQQMQFDQVRYRNSHNRFASTPAELGWALDLSPQGHYRLLLTEAYADSYTAEAIPVGPQAADTACNPLRMAWRDVATVVYSSGPSPDSDPTPCW